MNELTKPIKDIIDRGKAAQRKTVEGILEFGLCVMELRDSPEVESVSGGSTFTKFCANEWGIGKNTTSLFLGIGLKYSELSRAAGNLPNSPESISYLAGLKSDLRDSVIKVELIATDTTRSRLREIKADIKLSNDLSIDGLKLIKSKYDEIDADKEKLKELRKIENERRKELEKEWKEKKKELEELSDEEMEEFKEDFKMSKDDAIKVKKAEDIIRLEEEREAAEEYEKSLLEEKERFEREAEEQRAEMNAKNAKAAKNPKASAIYSAIDHADDELIKKIRLSILNMTHPDKIHSDKYIDIFKTITENS